VAWWPTPKAAKAMPEVAKGMNVALKYVFSRTLEAVHWSNTTLTKEDPAAAIARIKQSPGPARSWRSWRRPGNSTKHSCLCAPSKRDAVRSHADSGERGLHELGRSLCGP
jgi:hypothetical protein